MTRKAILGLVAVLAVMVVAFQLVGVKIDPSIANDPGSTGPTPEAVEAATMAIRAEPKVKDLLYQQGQAVEWQVGILDDGTSREGYARYICEILAENGASTPRTQVRIVDIARVSRGESFRSASLGQAACSD